ncbi:hypothetical protein D5278_09145 [bacterium 1XD21-13]|jgi:hypothetical protein|nr:hypothetical protein [bacterium 1XD21-13]
MIYAEKGKEQECFIDFVEKALGILAQEKYRDFLAVFDNCRILTEEDLISALQYLDETRPVLKIDDPKQVKSQNQEIYLVALRDGSGYCMDYDLTTDGEMNDLTLQVEFLKEGDGYIVSLDDLHTL